MYDIKLKILFGQKISDDYGDKYIKIKINFDNNLHVEKTFFNDKNKYDPQLFSEECLYGYTKYFETIIMKVTSKNKSSKNEKKIKAKYIEKKIKKNIKEKQESMD